MRLILPDTYFDGPVATAELYGLLQRCAEGPHFLETEPLAELDNNNIAIPPPKFNAWLRLQPPHWGDLAKYALEVGLKWTFVWQPKRSVRLSVSDNWQVTPHELSPATAETFFRLPLYVVIEHAVNDRHFIKALTRAELLSDLSDAQRKHWLKFAHGGGLGPTKSQVQQWALDPIDVARHYIIFDSDSRSPGKPSETSEDLRAECVLLRFEHHQLMRRCIENYLPIAALRQWAHNALPPKPTRPHLELFQALERLSSPLRRHYNYKRGRGRDRLQRKAEMTLEWKKVSLRDRIVLREGIHARIATLFDPAVLTLKPGWIEDDDVDKEMFFLIKEILGNL